VVEDVLFKVDKFIFHVDFFVKDMKEDEEVPLILDRSFMKAVRIIIDVDERKLKVRARDDKVTFNLFKGLKTSNAGKECLQRDTTRKSFLIPKSKWTFQI